MILASSHVGSEMAQKNAIMRLRKEFIKIQKEPVPFIEAMPLESNFLDWHFVITGPPKTPYEGGKYHGLVRFPSEYPFKPPSIMMFTPSGRFQTSTRLCLSISDFHPESWNPLWSVSSIVQGVLSFMLDKESTYGSIASTDKEKVAYAQASLAYNRKNKLFCELFPHYAKDQEEGEGKGAGGGGGDGGERKQQPPTNSNGGSGTTIAAVAGSIHHQPAPPQQQRRANCARQSLAVISLLVSVFAFIALQRRWFESMSSDLE